MNCRKLVYFVFLMLLLTITGCRNKTYKYEKEPEAGISLSFDDYAVDQWYSLRELFLKHNAKVTFFVTKFHVLSDSQVLKLRALQQDGHEIGFHGANHVASEYYIKEHSLKEYIQNEIIAGLNSMNEKGFYPTSFAYPYGAKYKGTDDELLKYFYVLRTSLPIEKRKVTEIDDVFYSFKGSRLAYSVSIDRKPGLTLDAIEEAILKAKQDKTVVMFHGHEPEKSFDVNYLEEILKLATKHGVKFFRASDLVK